MSRQSCSLRYNQQSPLEKLSVEMSMIISSRFFKADIHLVAPTYCPPSGKSRPMIRSWGLSTPVYTAKLAGDPEYGCTLIPHSSGLSLYVARARCWHNLSTWKHLKTTQKKKKNQGSNLLHETFCMSRIRNMHPNISNEIWMYNVNHLKPIKLTNVWNHNYWYSDTMETFGMVKTWK